MMTDFTSGLPCEPVHEEPKERELIVEWWEVWRHRGNRFAKRVMPEAEEMSKNLLIPAHGFESKAFAKLACARNYPSSEIIHVRRTRKVKK